MNLHRDYPSRRLAGVLMLALLATATAPFTPYATAAEQIAFPGAVGYGQNAKGGRGGDVYLVTSLADSGPGTLRECVEAEGPRTCVFQTGGYIDLKAPLLIENPYLTIAGQTAPGDGITLTNRGGNDERLLSIRADHVIVRHIRIRPGPMGLSQSEAAARKTKAEIDGMSIVGANHVIVDHVSLSWSTDGTLDSILSDYVTVQHSIISESLHDSIHPKGPHGTAMGTSYGTRHWTSYGILLSNHNARVPKYRGRDASASQKNADPPYQLVNSVMHNWGWSSFSCESHAHCDVVGNVFVPGPDSPFPAKPEIQISQVDGPLKLYARDNTGPTCEGSCGTSPEDDWKEGAVGAIGSARYNTGSKYYSSKPLSDLSNVPVLSSSKVFDMVMENAGATVPKRDAVDVRVLNVVKKEMSDGIKKVSSSKSIFVDHPDDVGGYTTLSQGTARTDSDKDGMPDSWEQSNGLNPNNNSDRNGDKNGDGYTNLEDYLNELAGGA